MEIFLLILKIIGIVLLAILGLILFLILVVLITPIRYRLTGTYKDEKPDVLLNIHFWFHLISAKVTYTKEGIGANLRILFIKKTIKSPDSKKKTEDNEDYSDIDQLQQAIDQMEEDKEDNQPAEDKTAVTGNTEESKGIEAEEKQDVEDNPAAEKTEGENDIYADTSENAEEEPQKLQDKIVLKVKSIYTKISDKYQSLIKKKTAVEWLLAQEDTKPLLKVSGRQLVKTLKSILPKKFKGYLRLGLEDPGTMGMICAYSSVIYPSFSKKFDFTPVFGEKVIDADIDTKGRIILGAVLGHLLKIVIRKSFFKTLKNLKRFKKMWR